MRARRSEETGLLLGMLSIPSPSGGEAALAGYLHQWLLSRGVAARVDAAGNVVAHFPAPGQLAPRLLLLGHMDTVSGHIPVCCRDGRISGRGAVDAKGPLAAFICACLRLHRSPRGPAYDITLAGAVEEEVSSSRGARYLLGGPRPDWVVIGEPSGWSSLVTGYKGRFVLDYRLRLEAAHAASRVQTAAEGACDFWRHVEGFCDRYNEGRAGFDRLDATLRSLEAGVDPDGLHDCAQALLSFRLPPDFPLGELEAALAAGRGEGTLNRLGLDPAVRCPKNTPVVRALLRAIREVGGEPTFKLKTGTSDMNVVCPAWGVAGVAYGPGDSHLDHTPREHVAVDEYLKAIDVLERALGARHNVAK